ncbi:MAG TPA: HEAT repeat domain-containing protein [Nitrospirae bacterium]|nr:HEAT repeat domain-containing protein [Nitrospirota bacterium]
MTHAQEVKEIIQALVKAKKNLRIYPENNPVYARIVDDIHSRITSVLEYTGELSLKIRQHDIFFDGESVYHGDGKEENLALFFFKDGVRELTFNKGLPRNEMEDFLGILAVDFDREALDDDIVTLMWEKDFRFIHYMVDDSILLEDETYEERAVEEAKKASQDNEGILQAYREASSIEAGPVTHVIPITDADLDHMIREIEEDTDDKSIKLIHLLFEMLSQVGDTAEYGELAGFIGSALDFAVRHGNLDAAVYTLERIDEETAGDDCENEVRARLEDLKRFMCSEDFVSGIAEVLDEGTEFDEALLQRFASLLDSDAIPSFIHVLGELRSAQARRAVISILSELGRKDIQSVARGLQDRRWYVVRNIICILRQIGDATAVEHLVRAVRHPDKRVKKEAIRTLGVMGTADVLHVLNECISDEDELVRLTAVRAVGLIGTPLSKKILLDRVADRGFRDKTFNEKREFFEVLSRWRDDDVVALMIRALKRRTIFKRAKNTETRAAAAHGLGMTGSADALEPLMKLKNAKNRLLRDNVQAAIKRITGEREKRS